MELERRVLPGTRCSRSLRSLERRPGIRWRADRIPRCLGHSGSLDDALRSVRQSHDRVGNHPGAASAGSAQGGAIHERRRECFTDRTRRNPSRDRFKLLVPQRSTWQPCRISGRKSQVASCIQITPEAIDEMLYQFRQPMIDIKIREMVLEK
jgi:hypothetical protein